MARVRCKSGFALTILNLTATYIEGDGSKKDFSKVFEFYNKMANTDDRDALFMMDIMYFERLDVGIRERVSSFFFGRAAATGNRLA